MRPPRIRVLPSQLIDQIAAGEVVERPASVVKELCENALDAGARRIEVEILGGGGELIRVVDDGSGMTPEEAELAVQRHATSKLRSVEDLFALHTMGFRGEALPAIASVAELSIATRAEGEDEGYRLLIDGGVRQLGEVCGTPRGTQLEVRHLFRNVPARQKFLKAEATEGAHISDVVVRLALAHPGVHFGLRVQGRTVLELPPHRTLEERVRAALERRTGERSSWIEFSERSGEVLVQGCLAAPNQCSATSRGSLLFVNRRTVRDRGLLHALSMGYGSLVERGRYPLAVVQVEVLPEAVDINVHPQKLEVRFARPQEVATAVRQAVARACERAGWEASGMAQLRVYSRPPERVLAADGDGFAAQQHRLREALGLFAAPRGESPPEPATAARSSGFFGQLSYLGQLHRTFLLGEGEGELVLIDQHLAHERVELERLRGAHREERLRAQQLLFPETLELDPPLAEVLAAHAATLNAIGFDLECFSGRSWVVKAVPEALAARHGQGMAPLLEKVLAQLVQGGTDAVEMALQAMVCHSVLRAGDVIDAARARALLDGLDGVDLQGPGPRAHNRPLLLRISIAEIERRFGR